MSDVIGGKIAGVCLFFVLCFPLRTGNYDVIERTTGGLLIEIVYDAFTAVRIRDK